MHSFHAPSSRSLESCTSRCDYQILRDFILASATSPFARMLHFTLRLQFFTSRQGGFSTLQIHQGDSSVPVIQSVIQSEHRRPSPSPRRFCLTFNRSRSLSTNLGALPQVLRGRCPLPLFNTCTHQMVRTFVWASSLVSAPRQGFFCALVEYL